MKEAVQQKIQLDGLFVIMEQILHPDRLEQGVFNGYGRARMPITIERIHTSPVPQTAKFCARMKKIT